MIGVGFIGLQVASHYGYINIDWGDAEKKTRYLLDQAQYLSSLPHASKSWCLHPSNSPRALSSYRMVMATLIKMMSSCSGISLRSWLLTGYPQAQDLPQALLLVSTMGELLQWNCI
ncbi:unnamed protein product [Chrysoparadoxa australica]